MMKSINRDALLKIKCHLKQKIKFLYELIKAHCKKRNLTISLSVLAGLILFFSIYNFYKQSAVKNTHIPQFETKIATQKQDLMVHPLNPAVKQNDEKALQSDIAALKSNSNKKMQALQVQLQILQSRISLLASKNDMQKLQKTVAEPNSALLLKIANLQNSVQKIIQQTTVKKWVDPTIVQKYFRLVAVQGFSDGMRAIIDIDGNQTTLSDNEICPACHGWVLQKMNFPNQTAVFSKQKNGQISYVKLQSN